MKARFPKYRTHEEARCFRCGALLHGSAKPSGYGVRSGSFLKQCSLCGMSTWYDLKSQPTNGS